MADGAENNAFEMGLETMREAKRHTGSVAMIHEDVKLDRYVVKTRADDDRLARACQAIEQDSWGRLWYLNFTSAHFEFYEALQDRYLDHQLCLVDRETDYPVAVANTAPFCAPPLGDLPAEGWDWMVRRAMSSSTEGRPALGGFAVTVPEMHRGKGFARRMIREMKAFAQRRGREAVIIAVRPTAKARHPHVPIEDYLAWTDATGRRAFDPWLRSHGACGGEIVGACARSMVVDEPIAFWELWRSAPFPHSGRFILEGALAPVIIDFTRGRGLYEEPNVWVAHRC